MYKTPRKQFDFTALRKNSCAKINRQRERAKTVTVINVNGKRHFEPTVPEPFCLRRDIRPRILKAERRIEKPPRAVRF